ncbi:hypothetical protein PPACK8108_LOCUS18506 [Phakopsora pachyrhizi]|uniref:Uncharacterized protein n=1 Tax=Phakopsora pachyrhizi TaxID=170000 RepID=A0AAV0BD58_PHAPC|nr:hypothetical protein PPACK8108_LOCUS18506 [Phakopsora pachyrhizi]
MAMDPTIPVVARVLYLLDSPREVKNFTSIAMFTAFVNTCTYVSSQRSSSFINQICSWECFGYGYNVTKTLKLNSYSRVVRIHRECLIANTTVTTHLWAFEYDPARWLSTR